MHDHNLDDLILNKPSRKRSGVKNFLTLAGLLVVILIAGIVLSRMILNDAAQTLVPQEIDDIGANNPELELKQPSERTSLRLNESDSAPSVSTRIELPKKPEAHVRQVPQQPKQTVVAHTDTKPKRHATKAKPAKQEKSQREKTTTLPSEKRDDFYIQVGSFSKTPPEKSLILQKIKRNRFSYIIRESRYGSKKVLIGPYKNRAEADRAIVEIRRRITPQAFVVVPKR